MAEKKKLIDEALLDIASITAVLKANTKEILRATMHDEITDVVKESLQLEADYDEEDVEEKPETDDDSGIDAPIGGEETPELPLDSEPDNDIDDSPVVPDASPIGGEEEIDTLDLTSATDDEVISVFKKMSGEDEIEIVSDTEVKIKDPQSGNEYVVKIGGGQPTNAGAGAPVGAMGIGMDANVEPEGGDEEFELSLGDESPVGGEEGLEGAPEGAPEEFETEPEMEEESVVYEIELHEMEDISKRDGTMGKTHGNKELVGKGSMPKGDIEGQKGEKSDTITGDNLDGGFVETTPGKKGNHATEVMKATGDKKIGHKVPVVTEEEEIVDETEEVDEAIDVTGTSGIKKNSIAYQKNQVHSGVKEEVIKRYNSMLKEVKALRQEREEFKSNLGKFRDMLAEAVVYNSNLTYVVKLFTEHSTTKNEKENIMKRFDSEVTSLKESKKLYKTLSNELVSKKTITETKTNIVEGRVQSSSVSQLSESTAYVDASTQRIKDLINRVENR